jgi:hypothetical protein
MAARSQDKGRQGQDTARNSAALDAVKTVHQAEAAAERQQAGTKEQKANRAPQDVDPKDDSPKRHGDKMERAVRAAAGRTENR